MKMEHRLKDALFSYGNKSRVLLRGGIAMNVECYQAIVEAVNRLKMIDTTAENDVELEAIGE